MIKNIIFDIGNVLISYRPEEYLDKFHLDEGKREAVLKGIFKSAHWAELDRGSITQQEAVELFCRETPEVATEIAMVMEHWMDMLTPIPETITLFMELKQRGYYLYVLSNYHEKAFKKVLAENDFFRYLDGKVVSYELKLIKPQREIYEYIIEAYHLVPEESLFIDDMPENLVGAEALNINTYQFTDTKQLREYLIDKNVL